MARAGHLPEARDSEIENPHAAIAGNEDVLGLEVSVDDPLGVRGHEHIEELVGDREHFVLAESASVTLAAIFERFAVEEFHDEERRPILGDIVVRDANDPVVTDGVRRVALAHEARAHIGADAQLRVKDLDRHATAVAMRGCIDGRHATDAEQHVEAPLLFEHAADALAGPRDEGVEQLGRFVVVVRPVHPIP